MVPALYIVLLAHTGHRGLTRQLDQRAWVRSAETCLNMHRISRGLVAVTAATAGRPVHGTRATTREDSPLTLDPWDYYRDITQDDALSFPLGDLLIAGRFRSMKTARTSTLGE